jgi:hypothetical protein
VAAILILFLATRIFILAFYEPPGTDITVYHGYISRAARGEVAYRDFAIEYPPLAWSVMTLPGPADYPVYQRRFRYTMFAAETAGAALFAALLWRRRDLVAAALMAYLAATTALAPVLYDRLDAGLLFLLMLWAYSWQRGLTGAPSWTVLSYAVLGLGVAFKLTPIVIVPVLLVTELTGRGSLGRVAMRVSALAAGMLAPLLPHLSTAGSGTLAFLQYHAERGIEIESFFANMLWALARVGLPIAVEYRFTSFEVTSRLSEPLAFLSTVLMIAVPLAFAVRAIGMGRLYDGQAGYRYACLLLPAMLAVGKVLSPQYFVWAIPMLLLVGAEVTTSRKTFAILCLLVTAMAILTTGVYPLGFGALRALRPDGWLVLTARNALLAGVSAWLAMRVMRRL